VRDKTLCLELVGEIRLSGAHAKYRFDTGQPGVDRLRPGLSVTARVKLR